MSLQVSRNPYLKAYRDKRNKKKNFESEREIAMKTFVDMLEYNEPEPVDKAVRTMKKMQDDEEVQRQGVFALGTKAITHPRQVIALGGLEVVLAAMSRYGPNGRLQFDGCECLWRLSMDEEGAQKVLDAGGLQAVLSALSIHPENVRVQEEASGCLRWFAERDADKVVLGGGLETAIQIMNAYPQFSWIQMWGCGAMLNFAEVFPQDVADMAGFDAVKRALDKYPDCPEVQRLGKATLKLDPASQEKCFP
eukprot:TRINITY_DN29425_c0_g1_i1.p1 TRINITY_DN29425_c0_g1~~TRINITY_DN29425_c0_g1_i1.p1  ORF type:complete len:250 (-),score=59.98 TRINITY_DN29425_c0_g1_i1:131-880(-)